MNETFKLHLVSAGITFLEGFTIAIIPSLQTIDPATIGNATVFALIAVGVRGAYKLLLETYGAEIVYALKSYVYKVRGSKEDEGLSV